MKHNNRERGQNHPFACRPCRLVPAPRTQSSGISHFSDVDVSHVYTPERKLSSARYVFLHSKEGLGRFNFRKLWGLTSVFKRWVGEECYLCARVWDSLEEKQKVQFWPATKRGNEAYVNSVKERIRDNVPGASDLKKDLFASDGSANILHITLTIDPKRLLGDVGRSWMIISREYNKFISAFRKRYGRCWVLRSFEAQRNGYVHVHLFVICENSFNAKWHVSKKGKSRWIVSETKDNHTAPNLGVEVDGFKNLWKLGFVNCCAVGTRPKFRDNLNVQNYVTKYIVNSVMQEVDDLERSEAQDVFELDYDRVDLDDKRKWIGLLTYSLLWLFRKQAFAISDSRMLEDVFDLILRSITQTGLIDFGGLKALFSGCRFQFIEFLGVVHMVRPPPTEPVVLSWEDIDELKGLAIGNDFTGGE